MTILRQPERQSIQRHLLFPQRTPLDIHSYIAVGTVLTTVSKLKTDLRRALSVYDLGM